MLLKNGTFQRISALWLVCATLALSACGGGASKEAQKEESLIATMLDESSDSLETQSLDDQASYKVSNLNLIYRLSDSDHGTIRGEMNYAFSISGDMNPGIDNLKTVEVEKGNSKGYSYSFFMPFTIPLEGLRANPAEIKDADKESVTMSAAMNTAAQTKPNSVVSSGGTKIGCLDLMSIFNAGNAVKTPKGRTYYRGKSQGWMIEGFITARNQPELVAYFLIREPGQGLDSSYLLKVTAEK